jgi:Helix-turn-helix domain
MSEITDPMLLDESGWLERLSTPQSFSEPTIRVQVGENTPFDESEWIKLTDATEQEWLDRGPPSNDAWRDTLRRLVEGDYPDHPRRSAEAALEIARDLVVIFGDYPDEAPRLVAFLRALYSGRLLHERTRAREDPMVLLTIRYAIEAGDEAALAELLKPSEPLIALLVRVSGLAEERLRERLRGREADARARAVRAAVAAGHTAGEIARELGVARRATVQDWLKRSEADFPPPCDGSYTCGCPLHVAERKRPPRRPTRRPAQPWLPRALRDS